MPSNTDVLIQPLSLLRLVWFHEIGMPLFQRPFNWGSSGENFDKALQYFDRFLQNKEANLFFGAVFVHATRRYDYARDEAVSVQLSDGQHRLATVVLAALALNAQIRMALQSPLLDEEDRYDLEKIVQSPVIKRATNANVHVVVNDFGNTQRITEFVNSALSRIDTLGIL